MNTKIFQVTTLVLLLKFCIHSSTACAGTTPLFRITQIHGANQLKVIHDKTEHFVKKNELVQIGDRIVTNKGEGVELEADDHSRLVMVGEGILEVSIDKSALQTVTLFTGKLLGWAHKQLSNAEAKKKYRFLVKTPSSVMGIRGTQFVVDTDESGNHSTIHVLEGVVDVAKNITELLTDNIVVVQTGELVNIASEGIGFVAKNAKSAVVDVTDAVDSGVRTVSSATPFDPIGFIASVNTQLPPVFHIPLFTGREHEQDNVLPRVHLASFEFYPQGYLVRGDVPSNAVGVGIGLSWNPTWHLINDKFDLRGHLGNSRLFKESHGLFADVEFKVLGTYILKKVAFVEAGPIARHFNDLKNGYGVSANTGLWLGDRRVMHLLDRLFFGVNFMRAPFSVDSIWEFRFGAGFRPF